MCLCGCSGSSIWSCFSRSPFCFPRLFERLSGRAKIARPWFREDELLLLFWFLANALGISLANIPDYG